MRLWVVGDVGNGVGESGDVGGRSSTERLDQPRLIECDGSAQWLEASLLLALCPVSRRMVVVEEKGRRGRPARKQEERARAGGALAGHFSRLASFVHVSGFVPCAGHGSGVLGDLRE